MPDMHQPPGVALGRRRSGSCVYNAARAARFRTRSAFLISGMHNATPAARPVPRSTLRMSGMHDVRRAARCDPVEDLLREVGVDPPASWRRP